MGMAHHTRALAKILKPQSWGVCEQQRETSGETGSLRGSRTGPPNNNTPTGTIAPDHSSEGLCCESLEYVLPHWSELLLIKKPEPFVPADGCLSRGLACLYEAFNCCIFCVIFI